VQVGERIERVLGEGELNTQRERESSGMREPRVKREKDLCGF